MPDSNNVGSIADWVGNILTAGALYFALRRDRPKIVLSCLIEATPNLGIRFVLHAINNSFNAISIVKLSIKHPKYLKTNMSVYDLNILLAPAEKSEIHAFYKDVFENEYEIYDNRKILRLVCAYDQYGKKYFIYNGFRDKIYRLFFINLFGRKSKFHEAFRKKKEKYSLFSYCEDCGERKELEKHIKSGKMLCEKCFNKKK